MLLLEVKLLLEGGKLAGSEMGVEGHQRLEPSSRRHRLVVHLNDRLLHSGW